MQRKALFSEALGKTISLKVTTYALRQMDRMGAFASCSVGEGAAAASLRLPPHLHSPKNFNATPPPPLSGGLDNYITGTPAPLLASAKGESLRRQIAKAARAPLPPAPAQPQLR